MSLGEGTVEKSLDPILRRKPSMRLIETTRITSTPSTSRKRPPRKKTAPKPTPTLKPKAKPTETTSFLVELWELLQSNVREDASLTDLLKGIQEPVIIIDRLNQIPALGVLFNTFNYKLGSDVLRGNEYILSTVLHSIGCHRGACRGQMGIQKLRLEDPLDFEVRRLKRGKEFLNIAEQAPEITFIEVFRKRYRSEDLYYQVVMPDYYNYIKIISNEKYSKEIDDMLTVALFLRIKELGKEAFIQSCDKYRWMIKARLSNKLKLAVKKNQLMPYFLSKDMMEDPAMILMGFECAYDCTTKQAKPHDAACILKTEKKDPKYI